VLFAVKCQPGSAGVDARLDNQPRAGAGREREKAWAWRAWRMEKKKIIP
jgi:hypothetical protein